MNIVVFDEFDAWGSFTTCVGYTGDREYCRKAFELLAETQATEEFVYGNRSRFRLILPMYVRRHYAMAIDKSRRAVIVFVSFGKGVVALFYEKTGDSHDFQLKFADWITTETKALKNPHPTSFTQHL
jgi:hypothetical protein